MRVALLAPPFESVPPRLYGGTERVVHALCRGLVEAGVDVTLFASGDSHAGVRTVAVCEEALRLMNPPAADPSGYHMRMLGEVAARSDDFDLIHNHHDYWMLPLSEMRDVPLLTTLHGRLDRPELALPFDRYPRAVYVSISDSQRRPMPRLSWLRTIYHGIDARDYSFQSRPGAYLAFLGRITAEKRPEWAIEIARRSGVPLKIAAKIEGREGQAYYDAHVRPHVDGRFIEFLGEIAEHEKAEFLGNALALTFPIDWPEPFGLVVIESLACGTPVLALPRGAVPELFENGVHGFVEATLERLAERVKDVPRLSREACREWVETRFSLSRMTEEYLNVYRFLAEFSTARARTGRARRDRDRRDFLHPFERTPHRDT